MINNVVRSATLTIAAINSFEKSKIQADYVCDGISDQAEINNAINALPSTGGIVKLLEGTYTLSGHVSIPNNVSIIGCGFGTLINFDVVQDLGFRNADLINGNYGIIIANMKIDGFDKTNDPIELRKSHHCQIRNLEITRGVDDGVELSGCHDCTISNVFAHDSKLYHGIELDDVSYNNIVTNCISSNNSLSGIGIEAASHDNLITGCILKNNTRNGIALHPDTYGNVVVGNIMRGNVDGPYDDPGVGNLVVFEGASPLFTGSFTGLADTPANYAGSAGKYAKVNAAENGLEFGVPAGGGAPSGGYLGYIKLSDVRPQGTGGGTFAAGAWRTRTLNTEDLDSNDDCSLSSNQFILTAGTYECSISAPVFHVNRHQAILYNVTGATTLIIGTSGFDGRGAGPQQSTRNLISGRFTVAAGQVLEIRHQCQTTQENQGFGVEANFTSEIYTIAEFWRVS